MDKTNETLNTVTHLVGVALATVGTAGLLIVAGLREDVLRIVSFSIYGSSLIATYLASTLYHALAASCSTQPSVGVLYTAGFALFAMKFIKRHHEIWHFFVLGGSACHFTAIALYVL